MSRKQENSFGVVARTGFSLLALGFGSALFGALVVGPMLAKPLGQDRRSSARPAASETQLASTVLNNSASTSGLRTSRAVETEAEPAEKAESKSEFAEGPGVEGAVSSAARSYTGPTEDPDATSTDVNGEHTEPAVPKTTVRSDPFSNPSPVKAETPKAVEAAETPKERAVVEPETPKRNERTERRDDEERKSTRDGERTREREARSRRTEETTRERKSERREESTPTREERKSSRDRVAEERTRDDARVSARTASTGKREKVEKTRTAKTSETPNETDAERAEEAKLYRVRVGRVHPREEAEKLRDELKDSTGVDAFLVPVGEGFQIQTGAYKRKANADKIAATLRAGNFITVVRQDP